MGAGEDAIVGVDDEDVLERQQSRVVRLENLNALVHRRGNAQLVGLEHALQQLSPGSCVEHLWRVFEIEPFAQQHFGLADPALVEPDDVPAAGVECCEITLAVTITVAVTPAADRVTESAAQTERRRMLVTQQPQGQLDPLLLAASRRQCVQGGAYNAELVEVAADRVGEQTRAAHITVLRAAALVGVLELGDQPLDLPAPSSPGPPHDECER